MINKYTFNPPLIKQPGDTFRVIGKYLEQWRGDVLVRRAQLVAPVELQWFESVGGEVIETLYLEAAMPGQNVSMTNVRENQSTGIIIVDFSSGNQIEFADWAAVGEIANGIDSAPDLAEKILLGKAFRASPDGANKTTQIGASVSTNLLASEPIVYTEAQ